MINKRLPACLAALCLAAISAWLLKFGWEQRHLFYKDYRFSAQEAERLYRHADILYTFGQNAEARMNEEEAGVYYARAAVADPLHIDAWLHLAAVAAAAGDLSRARGILDFCHSWTGPVLRWKWPHTLLAHELGMEKIFREDINFLVARGSKLNDALYLLDRHCEGDPGQALSLLTLENQPAYFSWAIRWQNREAAHQAWQAVSLGRQVDAKLLAEYVHFLVSAKEISEAARIWRQYTGISGMTNGGFEEEITRKGFDWRMSNDRYGHWDIRRLVQGGRQGGGMRVSFDGGANVNFQHLWQVAEVAPETSYRLKFWWRDKGLSTDQVPFVALSGYDCKGFYVRGPALEGAQEWQSAEIAFTVPAECTALVVALRRLPSQRFDNKIYGSVWLDDFELIPDPAPTARTAGGAAPAGL